MNGDKLPVLVESAATVLAQMLGEHGLEGSQALWCLNVANNADNHHWWCFNDGHSLDGFLLVQLFFKLDYLINLIFVCVDEVVDFKLLEPNLSTSRTMWVMPDL